MAAKFNHAVPCAARRQGNMSKGRPAEESAEKNRADVNTPLRTIPKTPKPKKPSKGIFIPDRPSDKAIEEYEKGNPIVFT